MRGDQQRMTKDDTFIYVDHEIFLGRLKEQDQFREVLRMVRINRDDKAPPFIMLIHGDEGMGKSQFTRRLYDIVSTEAPFTQDFQALQIDWEPVRSNTPALRTPRDRMHPEAILAAFYQLGQEQGWSYEFEAYRTLIDQCRMAEQTVAKALERERGHFTALRNLDPIALGRLARLTLPPGEAEERQREALRQAGIRLDTIRATSLRQQADRFLRACLKPKLYDVYRQPYEQLAWALGQGFRKVTRQQPLVILLDSYDIVAPVADLWIRSIIKSAGPGLVWVISGQDNLADNRPGNRYLGYSTEFPRRLIAWDIQALGIQYVSPYLTARAPSRPPSPKEIAAIHHITLGVPLALSQAADLWAQGVSSSTITAGRPDYAPHEQFIRLMCERVIQHIEQDTVNPLDRLAMYILAMQPRPDDQIQIVILRSVNDKSDPLPHLTDLGSRYSVVKLNDGARLHPAMRRFLIGYLLRADLHTHRLIRQMAEHAVKTLQTRQAKLAKNLPGLPERIANEDWRQASLDLVHWLFWQDEKKAWRELIPRFVEGLGYNPDFSTSLIQVASNFLSGLGKEGRMRLRNLAQYPNNLKPVLTELEQLAEYDPWLEDKDDEATAERQIILLVWQGRWLVEQHEYEKALQCYLTVEKQFPLILPHQREQLAQAFNQVGWKLGWARGFILSSENAELAMSKAAAMAEANDSYWVGLGVMKYGLGQQAEAIEILQRAIEVGYAPAYALNWLGHIYREQGDYDKAIDIYQQAIKANPKYSMPQYGLGNTYRDLARDDEALEAYKRAVELDPTNTDAYYGLGTLHLNQGRPGEALKAYQQAINIDPNDAYPYNGLGNIYRTLSRYDEAATAYQHAIRLDPQFTAAYNGLGNIYRELGYYNEALAAYEQAIELNIEDPYPHNGLGNVCHDLGYYDRARAAYRCAIDLAPNYAYPYYGLGNVYRELARYDEAIEAYLQAIKLAPNDAYPYHGLGNIYRHLARHNEAIAAYQQAVELDSDEAAFQNELGNALRDARRYDEAITAYQQAIELDPDFTAPHNGLGNVYRELERYEEAITAYKRAITLDPGDADFHYGLGNIFSDLGYASDAIAAYQQAIALEPADPGFYDALGTIYSDLERYDEAIAAFQQAITLDPNGANSHNGLGLVYMMLGQHSQATAALQHAVKLEPEIPSFHISLANVLNNVGLRAGALEQLAQARQLIPSDEYYDLACLEAAAGDIEAALDHLEKALVQTPEDREWARRDPDLESLRGHPRFETLVRG